MKVDTGLLNPFIPSNSRPWNKKLAAHLLNRTMFGAKVSDINQILSLTPSESVDLLFSKLCNAGTSGFLGYRSSELWFESQYPQNEYAPVLVDEANV
ncbi:MAG: hypothetical protein IPH77_16590 [Ignavibacteria bacterium]|nr:hypothetical protein [Ignavibacteria bacterium]